MPLKYSKNQSQGHVRTFLKNASGVPTCLSPSIEIFMFCWSSSTLEMKWCFIIILPPHRYRTKRPGRRLSEEQSEPICIPNSIKIILFQFLLQGIALTKLSSSALKENLILYTTKLDVVTIL